jgi:hypothetical protein
VANFASRAEGARGGTQQGGGASGAGVGGVDGGAGWGECSRDSEDAGGGVTLLGGKEWRADYIGEQDGEASAAVS